MDLIPLAPSQGSTCPCPGGLDFSHLYLSRLHGCTMLATEPLSQTLVIQELLPLPRRLGSRVSHRPFLSLCFPQPLPSSPAFCLIRSWELELSSPPLCTQAHPAQAKCVLEGLVQDLRTYCFCHQMVDQENELCLVSLIFSQAIPSKAPKYILFLWYISNSIIWPGVCCRFIIQQYLLTIHCLQNAMLDIRVQGLASGSILFMVISQRKYH